MANGRMWVSGFFRRSSVNEKSRVSVLAQKSVRTIALAPRVLMIVLLLKLIWGRMGLGITISLVRW
jgi:hypothetical protein